MIAPDVNVLLYAFREDSDRHREYRQWLVAALSGAEQLGLFDVVQASFLRIATHPRIYKTPTPPELAWKFLDTLLAARSVVSLRAGEQHWEIFRSLCEAGGCRGNLVQDAFLAALALEHNCVWVSTDGDFGRFPQLRWRHPLSV